MRWIVALCVGCSYEPQLPGATPGDDDAPALDASPDGVDGPPAVGPCATPAGSLELCFQLEGNLAMFVDDSTGGHSITATGFTPTSRPLPTGTSQAALAGTTVSAIVPQFGGLELTGEYTLAAWVMPVDPNPAANEGILDHDLQFAMSIQNTLLTCWFQREQNLRQPKVATTNNEWQFAACTLKGNQACTIRIPITGAITMACEDTGGEAVHVGQAGMSIGSFQNNGVPEEIFNGAIDDIRVYARALDMAELCALADRDGC